MGDAADDAYDAMLRDQEKIEALRSVCPNNPDRPCNWNRDEDGLLECLTCGNIIDE